MNPRWGSGHLRGKVIELLVNIDDDILVGGLVVGKTMGKPWENHGKTMGKPWENGDLCCNNGWLMVWNHGILNDFP